MQPAYMRSVSFLGKFTSGSRISASRGLVPQAGSGRKSTKRKVRFRDLPPLKKRKIVVLDQDQDDFQLWS